MYNMILQTGCYSEAILEMDVHIALFRLRGQWGSSLFCGSDPGSTPFVRYAHANHEASHHNQSNSRKAHRHRQTSDVPWTVGRDKYLADGNASRVA